MAERKTKTVTTPSGATVELKEYLTAGEFLDLNEESEKNGDTKTQAAKRIVEAAIVSIDGSKENIPAALRELSIGDYVFLNKEVADLVNGNFPKEK
jgi:hypothetical protein